MFLHGVEEVFVGEVVIDEFLRFLDRLVAHGKRQCNLFDRMDVERVLRPLIDQPDRFLQQRCIAIGDAAQAAVVELEAVRRRDAVDLQAAREFFVVRPVTDVTPVIFEAVHHVTAGRDHAEQPVRRIEKQRVGVDKQGFFRQASGPVQWRTLCGGGGSRSRPATGSGSARSKGRYRPASRHSPADDRSGLGCTTIHLAAAVQGR